MYGLNKNTILDSLGKVLYSSLTILTILTAKCWLGLMALQLATSPVSVFQVILRLESLGFFLTDSRGPVSRCSLWIELGHRGSVDSRGRAELRRN